MIVFLALLFLCWPCASDPKPLSRGFYRDQRIEIRLIRETDSREGIAANWFDHPWQVDLATLESLLGSITYRRFNKVLDAFPSEIRTDLAAHLQRAFAKAEPDEVVDFSFTSGHAYWTVFKKRYLTDGVLFRRAGKLNCAFRNIAHETAVGSARSEQPWTGDPTKPHPRTDWELMPQEGMQFVRFPNWIQVDLAFDWAARKRPKETETSAVPDRTELPGEGPAGAAESPPAPAGLSPGAQLPAAQAGTEQSLSITRQEIDQRLRYLEELHREGDLTDKAYEQRKRELQKLMDQLP